MIKEAVSAIAEILPVSPYSFLIENCEGNTGYEKLDEAVENNPKVTGTADAIAKYLANYSE